MLIATASPWISGLFGTWGDLNAARAIHGAIRNAGDAEIVEILQAVKKVCQRAG